MSAGHTAEEASWVDSHPHDPNPLPPEGDGNICVRNSNGFEMNLTPAALMLMPYTEVAGCLIVSTGHGASGPFTFGGLRLADLIAHVLGQAEGQARGRSTWRYIDVISADGFGTRLFPSHSASGEPILLAYRRDGEPLTRVQGLVRLIVPSETEDALRQVKWVAQIYIVSDEELEAMENGSDANS